ncbi:vomeronasal type-2 receptor 26-like [Anomaloglossus baeobatrachus]|uniref:vomeronasal type-2 receptor 26-like n=1 Tax=Anomaloglossus baeobatrachus TaxID=238106 RepID=UPI003F509C37
MEYEKDEMKSNKEDQSYRMKSNIDSESPMGYSRDGDIIIGGVLQVLLLCNKPVQCFMAPPSVRACILWFPPITCLRKSKKNVTYSHQYQNDDLGICCIFCNLFQPFKASKAMDWLKEMSSLAGFLLGLRYTSVPPISYGATDLVFNDRIQFPSVYRTIPNEYHQFRVILQLLLHFNWTFVGIISTDDDSNIKATAELKQLLGSNGICVEFLAVIAMIKNVDKLMGVLKTSSSNVVILYITSEVFMLMLQKRLPSKTWILPINVNINTDLKHKMSLSVFNGSLLISICKKDINGLQEFLFNSSLQNILDNPFIERFYITHFGFWHFINTDKQQAHSVWVEYLKKEGTLTDIFTYTIYNAVYFLAKALHEVYAAKLLAKQSSERGIKKLNIYLRHVHLRQMEEDLFFTPRGDVVNSFAILNWILYPNSSYVSSHVGTFLPSHELAINTSAIIWNPYFTKIPQSMCTEICSHGKRKSLQMGMLPCCFDCVPCSDQEIANLSGMDNCIKCPEMFWPNTNKTECIAKTIEYLSYDDHLGSTLAAIATTFVVASTLVMMTFVKHRNTAIVRANNRHLSYVLLIALTMSFICSLLFIGHPIELTCLFRQSLFLFVFSVAISSLLGKTITVIIVFNASKPGRRFKKWMGSTVSIGLTAICSFGQFLICVIWTICAPPIVEFDSKASHDKLIVQCMDVSMFYFYLAISYIGFLALLSFIVAYSARSLPDNFNEATHITFSMIMFCSVWLSFIPTYLSAKGKYTVAVEVFAILISSAGLLVCIFTPKCYVILLKPELNDKRHIQITITKKNSKKY